MRTTKTIFAVVALCLGPLACGPDGSSDGGNDSADMTDTTTKPDMTPASGTLTVQISPKFDASMSVEVVVDGVSTAVMHPGEAKTLELKAGSHTVQVKTMGYGYAVPGQKWSTSSLSVDQWVMRDLKVEANATTQVGATLCRDITGKWQNSETGTKSVSVESQEGNCTAHMGPFGFKISGDSLMVSGNGACDGTEAQILDNGNRIYVECPSGSTFTFTKVS
ncbi:MAG: hypothetical protein Q8P82_01130 [bacterium]|nr:hypothetical protein [bacterium]